MPVNLLLHVCIPFKTSHCGSPILLDRTLVFDSQELESRGLFPVILPHSTPTLFVFCAWSEQAGQAGSVSLTGRGTQSESTPEFPGSPEKMGQSSRLLRSAPQNDSSSAIVGETIMPVLIPRPCLSLKCLQDGNNKSQYEHPSAAS